MNLLSPKTVFSVIGDDPRQKFLAKALAEQGLSVSLLSAEQPKNISALSLAHVVIFPLPLSSLPEERLRDFLSFCKKDAVLFAGKVSPQSQALAESFGFHLLDYAAGESMAALNAVPTAEGAVQIALNQTDFTLWESHCMVLGFGHCGKTLALLLKGFGAHVTIAARNPGSLSFARTLGFETIPLCQMESVLPQQDILFNTIPAPVLRRQELSLLSPSCLVIDLASLPGGTDFSAAENFHLKAIHALALPGKTAPATAGKILRDTILQMLSE